MIKEIKLIFIEHKNHNIMQNTASSIKSERENNRTNFIGKKRKNSNDENVLSISKPITHCINRTNVKSISKSKIVSNQLN